MNRQHWNNMQLITLNKGQPNIAYINAQTWMMWVFSLCPATGSLLVQTGYIQKLFKEEVGGLSRYSIVGDAWENLEDPTDRKDDQLVSIFKRVDRQDLRQLPRDLASLHSRESILSHTTQETIKTHTYIYIYIYGSKRLQGNYEAVAKAILEAVCKIKTEEGNTSITPLLTCRYPLTGNV